MSKEEEKKGISVVGTFKRTDLSNKPNDEIGVEADLPIEEESEVDGLNISTSDGMVLNENKVKVFDMSSGRVVERDVVGMVSDSQGVIKDIKRQAINIPPAVEAQRRARSAVKTSKDSRFPSMWLILAAALILLILLFYFLSHSV